VPKNKDRLMMMLSVHRLSPRPAHCFFTAYALCSLFADCLLSLLTVYPPPRPPPSSLSFHLLFRLLFFLLTPAWVSFVHYTTTQLTHLPNEHTTHTHTDTHTHTNTHTHTQTHVICCLVRFSIIRDDTQTTVYFRLKEPFRPIACDTIASVLPLCCLFGPCIACPSVSLLPLSTASLAVSLWSLYFHCPFSIQSPFIQLLLIFSAKR
jgi:hypothetical protein